MFSLEVAIAHWRQQLAGSGIKSAEVLDELESHLRDDVEQQLQSGLGAQEAFEAAAQRIGEAAALKKEFRKAGPAAPTKQQAFLRKLCFVSAGFAVLVN